jgi:hypothetical protein
LAAASKQKTRKEKDEIAKVERREKGIAMADARFRAFRSNLVICWLTSNVIFYYLVQRFGNHGNGTGYIRATYYLFFGFNAFKFIFCLIYVLQSWLRKCCRCRRRSK